MIQRAGDLFAHSDEQVARVIPTNGMVDRRGRAVMGGGVALEAAQRNPWMPQRLGDLLAEHGNRTFHLGDRWVALPTKDDWRDPSSLELIERASRQLVAMSDRFGWGSVWMPRLGCGLGGLEWPEVEAVIEPIFDDRFVVLTPS